MLQLTVFRRPILLASAIAALLALPAMADPVSLYNNGGVLDDWGDPASQLSATGSGVWQFIAAAADDFVLPALGSPEATYQISEVRAPFVFFNGGQGDETPSDWDGIHVTIYANSAGNQPQGQPDISGGHSECIVSQFVPTIALTHTPAGLARPCFVVDIPVDFTLAQGTRYWLSLVPDYDAPPQTGWCLSAVAQTGLHAQRGASFGPAFWAEIAGNKGLAPGAPPAYSHKDLSFELLGVPEPTTASYLLAVCAAILSRLRSPRANPRPRGPRIPDASTETTPNATAA